MSPSRAGPASSPAPDQSRIAIIDIGSNSVRLVVFDGLRRTPIPVYNEKILCGLGRGLDVTGRLDPAGVRRAHDNLARLVALAEGMGASRPEVVATAAVRDAADGPDFAAVVGDEGLTQPVGWRIVRVGDVAVDVSAACAGDGICHLSWWER